MLLIEWSWHSPMTIVVKARWLVGYRLFTIVTEIPYASWSFFNLSPPRQNGQNFADDIFRCIIVNERFCISNEISLKFVPRGPIDNNSAFVQIMVWRRIGEKPLSEPMLARLTHICGTRYRLIDIKSKHHEKNIKTQKAHYGFEYFQINPRVEMATFSEKKNSRYNSFFSPVSPISLSVDIDLSWSM